MRFRYQLGTRIPLKRGNEFKYFYVPVAAEWFVDLTSSVDELFADKLRYYLGLGRIFGWDLVGEFYVIWQDTRTQEGQDFSTDSLILRFVFKRLWSTHDYMSQNS